MKNIDESSFVKWWKDKFDNPIEQEIDELIKKTKNLEDALEGVEKGIKKKKRRNKNGKYNGSIERLKEQREKIIKSIDKNKEGISERKESMESHYHFFHYLEKRTREMRQEALERGESYNGNWRIRCTSRYIKKQLPKAYYEKMRNDKVGEVVRERFGW